MSIGLDAKVRETGTKFRLFPQSPSLNAYEPEFVWVSTPAGILRPGPSDERMQVLDAIDKNPYGDSNLPPWSGAVRSPVSPGPAGGFDGFRVGSREFAAAHMFGGVLRVLDVWEDYFDSTINLASLIEAPGQKIELIPLVNFEENAQTGPGYIEMGYTTDAEGQRQSLGLNIDILAHEVGHRIVFDKVGVPELMTAEFRGFAESASDLVALIVALHFDSVIDRALETSGGNLYVLNELNRIGELSDNDQIRIAGNAKRMSTVVDTATPALELTQEQLHELGEPLTGALFDILVDLYLDKLIARGAISQALADDAWMAPTRSVDYQSIQSRFDAALDARPDDFRAALAVARDGLARRLALTWTALSPDWLTYADVAVEFLTADRQLTGPHNQDLIVEAFLWREISRDRSGYASARPISHAALRALSSRRLCLRSEVSWRRRRQGAQTFRSEPEPANQLAG